MITTEDLASHFQVEVIPEEVPDEPVEIQEEDIAEDDVIIAGKSGHEFYSNPILSINF